LHPGDLAAGFSNLEMTWLLYYAGAATAATPWNSLPPAIHDPPLTTNQFCALL